MLEAIPVQENRSERHLIGFQEPITIFQAMEQISHRQYLLPAIQRRFEWRADRIEMLFDSILVGYPINSFMFWRVTSRSIKQGYKFYEFLQNYTERFRETNPEHNPGAADFTAVVDGQQRLTSLYIGLKGSYAERRYYGRRDCDDDYNYPKKKLYLNLLSLYPKDGDNQPKYNFRFLTPDEAQTKTIGGNVYWFLVSDILHLSTEAAVQQYLSEVGLEHHAFAKETLHLLRERVFADTLINYYLETHQDHDKVLEIFIRTNKGGIPLSYSTLLLSIASANWEVHDARAEMFNLEREVYEIGRRFFQINSDFILKVCLVLFHDDIRFQVSNFTYASVKVFDEHWPSIKQSILAAFKLIDRMGFSDAVLRSKNAVIPIILYIHEKGIANQIDNRNRTDDDRKVIQRWLNLSLLKSIFGGQSDATLTVLRRVIREYRYEPLFPLDAIVSAFEGRNRNYSFDDTVINNLLRSAKGSNETFYLLSLLYPAVDYYNQSFDQDHLHPAAYFENEDYADSVPDTLIEFYEDPSYWNSVLNLQFLNMNLNRSKQDQSLESWICEKEIDVDAQLIPRVDWSIQNFPEFIHARKELLTRKIKELVQPNG